MKLPASRSRTFVQCMVVTALAGLVGCAQFPASGRSTTEDRPGPTAAPAEVHAMQGIALSVSGEPQGAEECFVRYEVAYPDDIAPVELALTIETEMKQDDGNWLGIGWMEGIVEQLPSPDAVGRPGGGGLLHHIHMEELLLACDRIRFRVIVHGCEPGPCPAFAADDPAGSFEVLVDDRSSR